MIYKSINEVAVEASLGVYGKGEERDSKIESLGYNSKRVKKIINKSLKYGLPERDTILRASNKTAKTSDGGTITYSDIWDLVDKTIKYYENSSRVALPNSEKYIIVSFTNPNGVEETSKIYYEDIKEVKSNRVSLQNSNDNSWDDSDKNNRESDLNSLVTDPNNSDGSKKIKLRDKSYGRGTNNVLPSISFYIKNMLNNQTIYLPTLPEDVSESFSTNYSQTELNGRSAPYQTYGGNEARTISLSAVLHQDLCDEKTGNLQTIVMYLKQLVYPRYNGSIVIPPYCYIKFGDMVSCYAIMDSIDFAWGDTIIEDSKYYSKCEVNFSFQELRRSSLPTVDNVFSGGKDKAS